MYPRKYSKKNSSRPPYVTAIKAIAITKVDSHGLGIVNNAMTAMVAVINKKTTQPNNPYPASIIGTPIFKLTKCWLAITWISLRTDSMITH